MRSCQPRQPTFVWRRFTKSRAGRKRRRISYLLLLMVRESRRAKTDYLYRLRQQLETPPMNYKSLTRIDMRSFLRKHLHWAERLQFAWVFAQWTTLPIHSSDLQRRRRG